jgi:hypothetical protein
MERLPSIGSLSVFNAAGHWFRGNLHTHTTRSDGRLSPEEALRFYRERGYDFLAISDHRVTTEIADQACPGLLVVPAIELDCYDSERQVGYHVVGLGVSPFDQDDDSRRGPAQPLVDRVREAGGIAVLAHPYWSGQDTADLLAVEGAFGIEVFNATCRRHGKERGEMHWDNLLHRGLRLWGVACDDAHNYEQDGAQGWVMVRALELTSAAILDALKRGMFYSTCGPAILDICMDGESIWVHCSPVQEIRFIASRGSGRSVRAAAGENLTFGRVKLPKSSYVRVECIDAAGQSAWSQPIFAQPGSEK